MPAPNERPLLIIFNPDQVSDMGFRQFIAGSGLISYWAQAFPNTMFVSSFVDAEQLTHEIHSAYPAFQFFVTDVSDRYRRDGYMPQGIWNLIYQSERLPSEIAS